MFDISNQEEKVIKWFNISVQVELEFRVPFLSIPVKKAVDSAMGWGSGLGGFPPSANLNVGAVVLAGVIVFGASVFLPALGAIFTKKSLYPMGDYSSTEKSKSKLY